MKNILIPVVMCYFIMMLCLTNSCDEQVTKVADSIDSSIISYKRDNLIKACITDFKKMKNDKENNK